MLLYVIVSLTGMHVKDITIFTHISVSYCVA